MPYAWGQQKLSWEENLGLARVLREWNCINIEGAIPEASVPHDYPISLQVEARAPISMGRLRRASRRSPLRFSVARGQLEPGIIPST